MGYLKKDAFELEVMGGDNNMTRQSVAAHTLYEKTHPFLLPGPGGLLDVSGATFEECGENRVRVSGSKFIPGDIYTVKLEGSKQVGFRSTFIAGMRDPFAISKIDSILDGLAKSVREAFKDDADYIDIIFHVYGKNGVMGDYEPEQDTAFELGIVAEAVAKTQETAQRICSKARIGLLHNKYEGRKATAGNVGFIFTPLEIPLGEVYMFNVYHLMEVEDPCGCFPVSFMEIGGERS
jgi:hypothetical protein